MDYMTLKEASEKCAVKMGTVWLIPKSAQKPKDGRRKENKHE